MKIKFYKYQGTGNDFIILDNRDNQFSTLSQSQVRFLCDRRFGIGADGLMLLNLLQGYDFQMQYYNADGAESSMCGNGGRCLVKFAFDMNIQKSTYHFLAIDGAHEASFDSNGWVQLKMKEVNQVEETEGDAILDTGSPHYVKIVNDVRGFDVFNEGKKIRNSKAFIEQGINVNFVELEEGKIWVRTYERGVENETYSCGTGVTASALVCAQKTGFNRVEVQTLGGNLAVEFEKFDKNSYRDIWLCGPATFVFTGEIELP